MLTMDGCRKRRQRLLDALKPATPLLLGDPLNLRYFAACHVDAFSLGADFGGLLLIEPDGQTTLYYDKRAPSSVERAQVDARVPVAWYDGKSPGVGNRRWSLHDAVAKHGGRVHDELTDPDAAKLWDAVTGFRRAKDADELDQLRACTTPTEAGHAWARANVKAGMTELDVYNGVFTAVSKAVGRPAVVYGDFTVSTGANKHGGPATDHVLVGGETFILDYSVVLDGYRSDFTNTLVVGGKPTADQQRLFDLCLSGMRAGEALLKSGTSCKAVYDAVRGAFAAAGVADSFPHHAGHGLGVGHPEAPFFVANATETLVVGDVVTLEPGLYVDGVGGVRIEHNYAITATGFERLSNHTLSLS